MPSSKDDLEVHQIAAALQEVALVGPRVEADDVVRQQPVVDLARASRFGSTRQASGWVQGMWTKWCRKTSGRASRTIAGQRVEVVVVDHHDGLVLALDLVHHGFGQVAVDLLVALLERHHLVPADVRRVAQVPEVVLDEPEHRVGDDVVEAVVGLVVGLDEAHAEGAALGRLDLERLAAVLAGDLDVLVGHRATRSRSRRGGRRGPSARSRGRPCRA